MSSSGRKRLSKWDSKEDTHQHHHSNVNPKSASYYRDNDPEPVRFNTESNGNRSAAAADDQQQHPRIRNRVSESNDNSYYSEQDEPRQQFFRRSRSRSNSRSRSRSPVYRASRDAGSYDRHKTKARDSPLPIREFSKRGGNYQFDQRETKYHDDDFREEIMMKGARSSDHNTDFPVDNSRREQLRDSVSDPRLRRHRSDLTDEKETQRREGDGEGEFHRSSNIPCKFFAAGFCRNGKYCRFYHPDGDRKQPQDNNNNNFYRHNNNHSGHKWNDVERLDHGKSGGIEASRASKGISESKRNGGSWIDDMEMSPDWDYGARNLKNPMKEEPSGIIGQSSQSQVPKDNLVTNYDRRSSGMFSYSDKPMIEKPIADLHQNYSKPVTIAPVQAFNQNTQNHNVLPYQSSLTAAAPSDFSLGLNLNNPESENTRHSIVENPVPVQNTVTKEQIDQISNISASIAQYFVNGQPIPQLKQALQLPLHSESSMAVQPTALHTQRNSMTSNPDQQSGLGMCTGVEGAPAVISSQVSNVDGIQTIAISPKASEENGDKNTDEAKGKKPGEDTNDGENAVDEDDESDEEDKKGKDQKGIRAFKFALVEIVKGLLKPAWKEGKMNKDGYKNIVKKVVEKVTGTMQSGNVPQTQEKIDHYLAASKPKLTKLVQAYISKIKKN